MNNFEHWWEWRKPMAQVVDGEYPLQIAMSLGHSLDATKLIMANGGLFGIVVEGLVRLMRGDLMSELSAGQWFSANTGTVKLETFATSKVLLICCLGKDFLFMVGGPQEERGRLRYIDGCTDTLLCAPWRKGEPCLNFLHLPSGVNQTMHTHPTDRVGVVVGGHGWCETPEDTVRLDAGSVFRIPAGGLHRFITDDSKLAIVAMHPDSDQGPTDEDHPMVSRTLVSGISAKYLDNIRTRDV